MPDANEITLAEILNEIRNSKDELNNAITRVQSEVKNSIEASETRLLLKIETLNKKVNTLQIENDELKNRVEILERNQRKNNLLIFGIDKPTQERSIEYICSLIYQTLNVHIIDTDISNFYSFGNQSNSPLKIEFSNFHKKKLILQNCRKLKNTNLSIVNELTNTQKEENKYLRTRLNYYRQNGNEKCYIKVDKLYIGNNKYNVDELRLLEITENKHTPRNNSAPATPTIENKNQESDETQPTSEAAGIVLNEFEKKKKVSDLKIKQIKNNTEAQDTPKNKKPITSVKDNLRKRTGSTNNK